MTKTFARIGTGAAVVAAIAWLTYTVTFAIVVQKAYRWSNWASSSALVVVALAGLVVSVAARRRFSGDEPDIGIVAFALGLLGAFGALTHAVYDLAQLAQPEPGLSSPFPTDPRGMSTFALTGLSLALFAWLGVRSRALPDVVQWIAFAAAICMVVTFVGRLAVVNPKSFGVKPFALAAGLLLTPATYLAFARSFRDSPS